MTKSSLSLKNPQIKATLEEAETRVFQEIQDGKNPRVISQIEFEIEGQIKRFNPAQIRRIKEKFESKTKPENRDPDKAKAFKLFRKGFQPHLVLEKTKLPYSNVKEAWEQYLEFTKKKTVPDYFVNNIVNITKEIRKGNSYQDILDALWQICYAYDELKTHEYPCYNCGILIPIRGKSLEDAIEHLTESKWQHSNCGPA